MWLYLFLFVLPSRPHGSLTALSLRQIQTQRSSSLLEGAGFLTRGRVPTTARPERGARRRRRPPCCPPRNRRGRNTSTYPCCWRRRASAPPTTTPSTKVTDQIFQLHCRFRRLCVCEAKLAPVRLCVSFTIPTSFAAGFFLQMFFFFSFLVLFFSEEFTYFYGDSLLTEVFSFVAFVQIMWIVRSLPSPTHKACIASLVFLSFIKGVDLIGTDCKVLWSLCPFHLVVSVSVSLSSCHCTSHIR